MSEYQFRKNNYFTAPIKDRGFMSDVSDEFWLTWYGQLIEDEFVRDGMYSHELDENYNPFSAENISGYERYAEDFIKVRNKEEHDFLKGKIDLNNQRRARLESSERDLAPAFVANLIDPINFIPLPFVKGATFISRAAKGGTASATLVGATEPIRRAYDPTATNEETIAYIGSAFFLGGLLSGAFARRTPAISKATKMDDGGKKIMDNVFESMSETEGKVNWSKSKFKINNAKADFIEDTTDLYIGKDRKLYNNTNQYLKNKKVINIDNVAFKLAQSQKETSKYYKPVHIEKKPRSNEYEIIVDTARIRRMYDEDMYVSLNDTPIPGQVSTLLSRNVKSADDLIKINILKEKEKLTTKPKRFESALDYEARIDEEVFFKQQNGNYEDFLTDTGKIPGVKQILDQLDKFTDTGKVVQTLKNKPKLLDYYGRKIFDLVGDFAAVTRGAIARPSAYMETQTRWQIHLQDHLKKLDEHFVEYMTGSKESKDWLGLNVTAFALKRGDWAKRFKKTNPEEVVTGNEKSYESFTKEVFDAVTDMEIYNSRDLEPTIKNAATDVRNYFKVYRKEAERLEMFASQRNIKNKIRKLEEIKKEQLLKGKYKKGDSKLKQVEERIKQYEEQLKEISDGIHPPFTMSDEYVTRIFDRDALLDEPDRAKQIIRDWYESNPIESDIPLDTRVEKTYERLVGMADDMDGDNILSMRNTDGQYMAGGKPLMQRSLSIPTKLLDDFVVKDVGAIMNMYNRRMATAVEVTRKFGDRHMIEFSLKEHARLLNEGVPYEEANRIVNAFIDAKDKMYGTFNTIDPQNINKKSAQFIRNWTSLSSMGKVVYTALADMGRPIMVNGVGRISDVWLKKITNPGLYSKMTRDAEFLNPAMELTSQNAAMERVMAGDMGTSPNSRGLLGGVYNLTQKMQAPFYWANLLTPWTLMMKRNTTLISQHRFIEDALKLVNKTANENDILRLRSYGIDERFAKNIAKLVEKGIIEKEGGLFLPNATSWAKSGVSGAVETLQMYRQAIKGDVERTIITPSPNDKFNMMYGVIRVDNEDLARGLDNEFGKALGFYKTQFGGKFQNAYMALPFQFYSWAISATRKLAMSGLSGRDAYLTSGALSMIMFAALGDYLKNGEYWHRKPTEEKILQAIEKSGVLAIFSDLPQIIETVTSHEYGIRPMFGMDSPFGEPEAHDAFRPGIGPGPSNILDIYMAYQNGSDKEFKDAIRRFIPLNNFWLWDNLFRKSYNNLVDY